MVIHVVSFTHCECTGQDVIYHLRIRQGSAKNTLEFGLLVMNEAEGEENYGLTTVNLTQGCSGMAQSSLPSLAR
jgi:hypothetical protein